MSNISDLKHGDIVHLKCGSFGIVSNIIQNIFGDEEKAYEILFFNNQTSIRRSKDFIYYL